MTEEDVDARKLAPTRIAIYDDLLSAPRVVDIQPCEVGQYIEKIAAQTYDFAQGAGSTIPYTVIREVCENFIHARFQDPCVSILDHGNTIRFTDQGPGIPDKERVQLPGFTSATTEMRQYIRGVGSGLPTVKEYLRFSNGRLIIEDNIKAGTVVTITVDGSRQQPTPVVYREQQQTGMAPLQQPRQGGPAYQSGMPYGQEGWQQSQQGGMRPYQQPNQMQQGFGGQSAMATLDDRSSEVLLLANELGVIGPTDIKNNLDIPLATASRVLDDLESHGYLEKGANRKRSLTQLGMQYLNGWS